MRATKHLLSTTAGMALLVASTSVAMAHHLDSEYLWPDKVHTSHRVLGHCDSRSRLDDFLPGGRHGEKNGFSSSGDDVVFQRVSFLTGDGLFTDNFSIDTAGTYQVTLTDFAFPNPMLETGINITSATESFGSLIGPGSFAFDAAPGDYYLSFFGKATGLAQYGIEIAQYGIQISQIGNASAVPVPATAWLFSTGLVGLAGIMRRKTA